MQKFCLKSGKILSIELAPIDSAVKLCQQVMIAISKAGLDFSISDEASLLDLMVQNQKVFFNIATSDDVMEAIQECAIKALYDKKHFSLEVFNDEKARQDLYPSLFLIMSENIRPFFPNLHTFLETLQSLVLAN